MPAWAEAECPRTRRAAVALIATAPDLPPACAAPCESATFGAAGRPLGEAISRALTHSPDVAMAEARLAQADARLRSARRGWFHPEVRVYAGDGVFTGTPRAGLQISHDVMRLLTLNGDDVRTAQHDLSIARHALTLAKDALIRRVSDTRLHLQRLEQTAQLQSQLVAHHDALVILAKTQFEQGSISLSQLLAAQDALLQAQQSRSQTQAEFQSMRVAWAQLLGDPVTGDDTIP